MQRTQRSEFVIDMTKENWQKKMTSISLNVGFYLQYLWDLRQEIEKSLDADLSKLLKTLCSFTLAESEGKAVDRKPVEETRRILAVYSNLISRGQPTFPSLLIERSILDFIRDKIPIQEVERAGAFRFVNGRINQMVEENWFTALRKAHFLIDPYMYPDQSEPQVFLSDRALPYESEHERLFYENYLPERIGKELMAFVEAQRPIASMVSEETGQNFVNQRVDFTLEVGNVRAAFEVDGPQHFVEPQKSLDKDRDQALQNAGWQVIRIPTDCIESGAIPANSEAEWEKLSQALQQNREVQTIISLSAQPQWKDEIGLRAMVAVLCPFAVARFQKVLLLALEEGVLSCEDEQWKLVVVEQDVPFARLGLVDFLEHIRSFQKLMGLPEQTPKVELVVYRTSPFSCCHIPIPENALKDYGITAIEVIPGQSRPFKTYDGDLLVDLAVLSTEGMHLLSPEFIMQHLHSYGRSFSIRSMVRPIQNRRLRAVPPAPYASGEGADEALVFFLQNIFRKKEFREGQLEILRRATTLRPVIGLLPTGAGKSLCYQLAALLQPGLTLIIDPLLSLMTDQMDNLSENYAIDWFGYINSELLPEERNQAIQRMIGGEFLFVFISPERFQNNEFRSALTQLTQAYPVSYAVIDEAHCVSEWGHDFRTSYLKLGKTILAYCRHYDQPPTIIALTGTASYAVLSDVQREIGVDEESAKVYPSNFEREELFFSIECVPSRHKLQTLIKRLESLPNLFQAGETFFTPRGENTCCGIVFTPHVNWKYGAYWIAGQLANKFQMKVEFFSGEVPKTNKDNKRIPVMFESDFQRYKAQVQRSFKRNEFPLLVATRAFGMGIDKPNIRYTVHYNLPQSLEAFYQEAGRAGRDREKAHCIVIFSDDHPERSNRLLQPDVTSQEIRSALEECEEKSDVERLLYMLTRSYRGVQEEQAVIQGVLNQIIRLLSRREIGESVSLNIDFGPEDIQPARDKALYRLSILGVVSDYTLNHQKRKFEVTAAKLADQDYIDNLQNYIKRYKTREVTELVPEQVQQEAGNTVLEQCVSYLLKFVYREIERKRRAAIKTMADIASSAAKEKDPVKQNRYIWQQMLSYLEHSPFTEDLAGLSRQIDPARWREILNKRDRESGMLLLESVDGVRQLLGGCRRALESDTENPGLLFLSALARLLLPDPEISLAMDELRASLRFLSILPLEKQESACQTMLQELHHWLQNTRNFQEIQRSYAGAFLDILPNRFIARLVHPLLPDQSENILLNLVLTRVQQFTQSSPLITKLTN